MDKEEYIESLSKEEKDFFCKFYKKYNFISEMNEYAASETKEDINIGIGNYNSDICLLIDKYDDNSKCIKFMNIALSIININTWNIYITYREKCSEANISSKDLECELSAVMPKLIFNFTYDKESFEEEEINNTKYVYINVNDVDYVLNKENNGTKDYNRITKMLKSYCLDLIQLREIE